MITETNLIGVLLFLGIKVGTTEAQNGEAPRCVREGV